MAATRIQTRSPNEPRIVGVTRVDKSFHYNLEMDTGFVRKYPYVWLKDNCRCPICFNAACSIRETFSTDIDPDIIPVTERVIDEGRALEVTWPGQHRSTYASGWLDGQRFSESEPEPISCPEFNVWGAEMNGNIPSFDYSALLSSDSELYNWLRTVQTTGIAVVRGAPKEQGVCRTLTSRVAFLRKTVYGNEEFQVICKPNFKHFGDTSKSLALHTDMPYYEHPHGLELLHCIEQCKGEGGENQFVDGLNIVRQLKEEHPDEYKVLSEVPLDYENAQFERNTIHMKLSRPIIDFDLRGELCLRVTDPYRESCMRIPVDQVRDMYKAMKLFSHMIYLPQNVVNHRQNEGEMVTFNNRRLLHGRSSFAADSSRHLEGGYIEWDDVRSRMRVLRGMLSGAKAP